MARLPVIEFENWRDPKGYRLSDNRPRRVVRIGRGKDEVVPTRPLDKSADLFLVFANTATTADGVLGFVQQHGPLSPEGADRGDVVDYVIHHAKNMHAVFSSFAAGRARQREAPKLFDGQPLTPAITFGAVVVWDAVTRSPRWEIRPSTLLDGLWLQLAQAATGGDQIRVCQKCGAWFAAGRGSGRRADAKFCSEEHKIAFHSLKRSKEK